MNFGQPPQPQGGFNPNQQQEYDNTNRGIVFGAQPNEMFLGCGKINIDGREMACAVIQRPINKEGRIEYVLYAKLGVLFTNTPKPGEQLHEKAPQYNGPLDFYPNKKMAAWVGEKNGRHYLQLKVEEKQQQQEQGQAPFGGAPTGQQAPQGGGFGQPPQQQPSDSGYQPDPMAGGYKPDDIPF